MVERHSPSGYGRAALAGDLRGDGTPDLIVGASGYDFGRPTVGAAFIYDLGADQDGDGVPDSGDNCPATRNPDQNPCACQQCGLSEISVSFSSAIGKGSGTVSWTTINEFDLRGFNVVELRASGARTQKNPVLIPCEECITGSGKSYTFIIPKHRGARDLFIEMVLRDGSVRLFGPARRM